MEKYYRHFKGNVYKLVGIAKDSETLEEMVVYQAMYGDGQMWVRPKEMFFGDVERDGKRMPRFQEICVRKNSQYHFPAIDYTNQKLPLTQGKYSKSVRAMISLLQKRGIMQPNSFQGMRSDDDLERETLGLIRDYKEGDDLENIFLLIQTWGGISGRGIFVRGDGYDWSSIKNEYHELVETCLDVRSVTDNNIKFLVSAVERFDKKVKNLGVAFITKHTRFWLHKSLGENNSLPIYDSIMARNVMGKDAVRSKDLAEYWSVMSEMARNLHVGLVPFERQIFRYFYNSRITTKDIWSMKDELTTEMHWEFMQDEMTREDFLVMATVGAMNRGATKADALKMHGLSEEYFDANVERVMNS